VALCAGPLAAQTNQSPPIADAGPGASAPPVALPAQPAIFHLAALTPIELTVLDETSSKTAIPGAPVRLALASPLYVSTELGLPAGTAVEGVVIHAAKPGMGGKSGELLLGAKRIALPNGLLIPLRSFKLAPARGRNNETLAFATSVAGGAIGGVASMFITGGSAKVLVGTNASAKTSADVEIPAQLLSRLPALPIQVAPLALPGAPTIAQSSENKGKNQ
jgi:hypothetical protein